MNCRASVLPLFLVLLLGACQASAPVSGLPSLPLLATRSLPLYSSTPAATPPAFTPTVMGSRSSSGGNLTVFAAASLTAAFTEIGKAFEAANAGTRLTLNFAGSQTLRTQIEQGAKADLFASADRANTDLLGSAGLVEGSAQVFARNRLVVIVPKDNPAGIKTLLDLARTGIKIDIADASVPVGSYTLQVLDKLSGDSEYGSEFKDQVLKRVVSKENDVKQVVSKVALGEVDAGLVYATDAMVAMDKLKTIYIPDQFNVIAVYPIVVIKGSANPPLAQKFVDYVLSTAGQAVLIKYGFAPR